MIAIYALLLRILCGERYAPPTREDTKLWLSALAAVPPAMAVAVPFARFGANLPLVLAVLSAAFFASLYLVLWVLASRLPTIKSVCLVAAIGWIAAFAVAFFIFR